MSYIGPNELIFNNDSMQGIHSGGFSVKSIMMKKGISPIMTLNTNAAQKGGGDMVSDLFNDLAVPNWAITYNMFGGHSQYNEKDDYSDSDEDNFIDDDLHNKLLDLVKQEEKLLKQPKNKITKRNLKKKGGTKKKI